MYGSTKSLKPLPPRGAVVYGKLNRFRIGAFTFSYLLLAASVVLQVVQGGPLFDQLVGGVFVLTMAPAFLSWALRVPILDSEGIDLRKPYAKSRRLAWGDIVYVSRRMAIRPLDPLDVLETRLHCGRSGQVLTVAGDLYRNRAELEADAVDRSGAPLIVETDDLDEEPRIVREQMAAQRSFDRKHDLRDIDRPWWGLRSMQRRKARPEARRRGSR